MALFLSLVICVEFVTAAVLVSATNVAVVASCTSLINDQCTQNLTSCLQPPCSLSCGRTSPQFSCSQDCVPSANLTDGYLCDALECQASQYCYQTCNNINCNSSTCTSNQCTQQCFVADCGRMVCKADVSNCNQVAIIPKTGQAMHCAARSCNQECKSCKKSFLSEMTCSSTADTCEQRGLNGKLHLNCLAGVKNCTQKTDLFSIANMKCHGDKCVQRCFHSTCDMNCSSTVRECAQSEDGLGSAVITMSCDAQVCTQHCGDSRCNMICSSSVKECTQTCKGTCSMRCDAEVCHSDSTTTTTRPSLYPIPTNSISKISIDIVTLCLVGTSMVTL